MPNSELFRFHGRSHFLDEGGKGGLGFYSKALVPHGTDCLVLITMKLSRKILFFNIRYYMAKINHLYKTVV